jgi:predicted ATPase
MRGWEVVREECEVCPAEAGAPSAFFRVQGGAVASSVGAVPAVAGDRLYLVWASGHAEFREIHDALRDMRFYQFRPETIPDIDTYDPQQRLRADGSNLASVLAVLQHADPAIKARLDEFLHRLLPTLIQVTVEPVFVERPVPEGGTRPNGVRTDRIALTFHQKVGRSVALFGPSQMSEGTLRALAILAALYQTDAAGERRPTLTALEDVEAAVHPAELGVLLDALEEASLSSQVIVTSQSSDLLDKRQVPLDRVLLATADEGVTRIGPVDEGSRSVIGQGLYTVGELLRIGQLRASSPGGAVPPGSQGVFEPEVAPS